MDEMKVLLQAILENVQMLNAKVERIEQRLDAVEHQLSEFREETKLSFTRTERHYRSTGERS